MDEKPTLSIILPCLNEEAGLELCLPKIKAVLSRMDIPTEVIVIDLEFPAPVPAFRQAESR